MTNLRKRLKEHERFIIPTMLLLGVAFDFFTFQTLKIETTLTVLGAYLLAAASLMALSFGGKKSAQVLLPLVTQFTFGALLSASLVFYWFSGSLSVSWPFLLILAALIASNEVFRSHFLKPTTQIALLFFSLFSYLTIAIPHLLNSISAWVFVLSGVLSLLLMGAYVQALSAKVAIIKTRQPIVTKTLLGIFLTMNAFYFLNIIPPIPLALRDAGVYHSVQRTPNGYTLTQEPEGFIDSLLPGQSIHIEKNKPLYIFTSIFAPADLNTKIIHEWEYFDQTEDRWKIKSTLSFPIVGGREGGYRGFSKKSSLQEGRWRVNIQTPRGQTLGRLSFTISFTDTKPELEILNK